MTHNSSNRDYDQDTRRTINRGDVRPDDRTTQARQIDDDLDQLAEANPNRDPITGETGSHPIGTGVGAAAAGTIGTAVGAIAGPVGGAIGAVIGGVIGGLLGKSTAEAFDPTVEEAYWQSNYSNRPYYVAGRSYDDYQPAYRTGYEGFDRYRDTDSTYQAIEPKLQQDYETGNQRRLPWAEAQPAARDAWNRRHYQSVYQNEGNYWNQNYTSEPYYEQGRSFSDYEPAYRLGYEGYVRHMGTGKTYDDAELDLRREYETQHGSAGLGWEKAKHAVQKAWHRAERAFK